MTPETIPRRDAFAGCALPSGAAAAAKPCGPATRLILRGGPVVVLPAAAVFGPLPPLAPLRSNVQGERAALWMGPDEWLLIAEDGAGALLGQIEAALADVPHALFDVSHRQAGLEIAGPEAARLLNAGVALDLGLEAFPAGMVVRTLYHKAEIVLWRLAPDRWRLETGRSFAAYVAAALKRGAEDWALA